MHQSEAFAALAEVNKTFEEMCRDETNFYAVLNEIPMEREAERVQTIKLARAQGTSKKLDAEMASVFRALFGG